MARQNLNRKRYNYNVNHYSSSEAYDYDIYTEERAKVRKKKTKSKKRRKPIKYVYTDEKRTPFNIGIVMVGATLFLCAFFILVSFSTVSLQRRHNQVLFNELSEMEKITNSLEIELLEARPIEEVEFIARHKLNMSEPDPHQIIHINVESPNLE